mgnify:CR=1 FL=1
MNVELKLYQKYKDIVGDVRKANGWRERLFYLFGSPAAIANFQKIRDQLGIDGGMLIANPVPEEHEISREEMEIYIGRARASVASGGAARYWEDRHRGRAA